MDTMDQRVRQALTWYDTAVEKYRWALREFRAAKEKAKADGFGIGPGQSVESPLVAKWRDRVRKYEEKLSRASAVLSNITMVMVALEKYSDAKEIILSMDDDDDEE